MRSGASSPARARASARISRPSASVLPTSTVRPARVSSTSPGRMASAETAFSTAGISRRSRTGRPRAMTRSASARAWAAPPMSFFIQRMPAEGLRSRPPVSNATPLPTSTSMGAPSPRRPGPGELDHPRRPVWGGGAADRVDGGVAGLQQRLARHARHLGAVAGGDGAHGGLDLGGAHGVGGSVHEVARQGAGLGEAARLVQHRGRDEQAGRRLGPVGLGGVGPGLEAPEAARAQSPGQRGGLGGQARELVKPVVAGAEPGGEAAQDHGGGGGRLALAHEAQAEQHGRAALPVVDRQQPPGLAVEVGGGGAGRQAGSARPHEPHWNGDLARVRRQAVADGELKGR